MSAGVHVDVDYPLEFTDHPNAAAVIDAFVLDSQKNFIPIRIHRITAYLRMPTIGL